MCIFTHSSRSLKELKKTEEYIVGKSEFDLTQKNFSQECVTGSEPGKAQGRRAFARCPLVRRSEAKTSERRYSVRKFQDLAMAINKVWNDNDSSVFFQNETDFAFFYGMLSFAVVLATLLLLYMACSRKYRLNWFEKNLLERANDFALGCSDVEKGKSDEGDRRNCSIDTNFWVPLYHAKSNTSVSECCSIGESCSAHLGSKTSLVSFTKDDNNDVEPIARSDKQVVLATTKPARPRVSSMNRKLDHTKIDSTLYEVPRSPSVENNSGSVCVSMFYDQASGILTVRLIQAKDLSPRDFSGTSDPYAKIRLLPDSKNFWQTRIHKKTLNPVFDEDFVFEVPRLSVTRRTLEIILYDFDAYSRHLSLGEVRLPLSDFELTEKVTVWKPLEPCSESNKKADLGELMVTLSYLPSAERLTVIVNKARNLRVVDESRLASDTFVKVSLIQDGKRIKKKRTSIQKNNVNPVFNESVTFDASKESLSNISVEFCVYHDNKLGPDEYLGKVTVGLGSTCQPEQVKFFKDVISSKTAVSKWLTLNEF